MDAPLQFHELPPSQQIALITASATPVYLEGEDNLQISSINSLAGAQVTVVGRLLDLSGRITPFQQIHNPSSNRTLSSTLLRLGDGWLLNLSVQITAGNPTHGQTWVRVQLVRGMEGATFALGTLVAGYATASQPLGWPGSPVGTTLDGQGAIRSIIGATPGAGAEISETVPTGARWEILAIRFQLVTAVAVANRLPVVLFNDGSNDYFHTETATVQAASLTNNYAFGQGLPHVADSVAYAQLGGLPVNNRLLAGHRWRTVTSNIQPADQLSLVQYVVREWLEGS